MANSNSLSAMDVEIIKSAFHRDARDKNLPESQWREFAAQRIQTYTGLPAADPQLVEWIIRK